MKYIKSAAWQAFSNRMPCNQAKIPRLLRRKAAVILPRLHSSMALRLLRPAAKYDASRYGFTTYTQVADFCRQQGGHLAVIDNAAENTYLFEQHDSLYLRVGLRCQKSAGSAFRAINKECEGN